MSSAKGFVTSTNFVLIGAVVESDKVSVVITMDSAAKNSKLNSNELLQAMLPALNGRGGGNADMAQGGGTNIAGVDQAFGAALESIRDNTK